MLSLNILVSCVLALSANVNGGLISKRADNDDSSKYIFANLQATEDQYLINVGVGSDNQSVPILVDTGSSDVWFPSNVNPYCESAPGFITNNTEGIEITPEETIDCSEYPYFISNNSTTFHNNETEFSAAFPDETVASGLYGQDSISIGDVEIPTVNFAVSNLTSSTYGHLGLSYPILESTKNGSLGYEYTSFLQQLVDDGKILQPAYSLYFNNESSSILFGAVDKNKVNGPLYLLDIVPTQLIDGDDIGTLTNIAISMNHLTYMAGDETKVIGGGYYPVVLNSALNYMIFPNDFVDAITKVLNLQYDEEDYYYTDCSNIQEGNFLFAFQGAEFDVPAVSFFEEITNDAEEGTGVCYFNVDTTDDEFITMGTQFLQNFYTVVNLHQNKVGLSYPVLDSKDQNLDIIEEDIGDTVHPQYDDHYGKGHSTFSFYDDVTASFSETASYSAPPSTATSSTKNGAITVQKSTGLSLIAVLFSLLV